MASTPRPDIRTDIHHGHALRIQRDSRPWQLQVWISFLLAVSLCAVGLAWLPGRDLDRAFMVMGYLFCLTAAFVLAKYIRDQQQATDADAGERAHRASSNTPMFGLVVWGGFFLAMTLTSWGLWRMEVNPTWKAYLGVSWLYLITCTFTLAKMIRDRHQADVADADAASRLTAEAGHH
ncbi:MAG: YiaA/YiaB family inner membrane protein [Polaromonas sp.]|nr:YiaA/YiaB family inner membrane protein [Polaromonas sp.]